MNSKASIPEFSFFQRIKLLRLGLFSWKVPTHTTAEELFELHYLAKSLATISVGVEIGSYLGASSLMIAKGLKRGSKLYCVDTWQNDAMTEGGWDSYATFLSNTETVRNKVSSIRQLSVIASVSVLDPLDILFIDGDHSYSAVKSDVQVWFPKLKTGGLIIMHDSGWAEGVIQVIEEDIKSNIKSFGKLRNMFWGWKK